MYTCSLVFTAIQQMASPYVTTDLDALDTNILLVNINSPHADAAYFIAELLEVKMSNTYYLKQ